MPLVFMTRGEREARSSKFYPGALRLAAPWEMSLVRIEILGWAA